MKKIQSVPMWYNGSIHEAVFLLVYCTQDNLSTNAVFSYSLYSAKEDGSVGNRLIADQLMMEGEEYDLWETNEYAFNWVANKLNLQIIS
jgi:hypothetical protein